MLRATAVTETRRPASRRSRSGRYGDRRDRREPARVVTTGVASTGADHEGSAERISGNGGRVVGTSSGGRGASGMTPGTPPGMTRAVRRGASAGTGASGLLLGLGLWVAWSGPAAAEVYRWEDRGLITYQDRAPDSTQDDGHAILNRQGVVLEEVRSREGRVAERKAERRRQLARIRDRALLATFTEEEDLVRTRDDRIGMIDGLISRLDDRIRILSERLAIVDKRVQMQEKSLGEDRAQESLYAERRSIQRNIENAWSLIDSKAAERSDVADKFDDDLARYRELRGEREAPIGPVAEDDEER